MALIELIKSPYSADVETYYDYYKITDSEWLTDRISNEMLDIVSVDDDSFDSEPITYEDDSDIVLGRLKSWYAGRELSDLHNIISYDFSVGLKSSLNNQDFTGNSFNSGTYELV